VKIEGTLLVDAPLTHVWPALLDPGLMAACIPGCSSIEVVSPTRYRGKVDLKIGPIATQFQVVVAVTDVVDKVSIRSTTSGDEGSRASMLSSQNLLTVRETVAGSTQVSYESTVSVSGRLGKFGLGMMKKTADGLAQCFGKALGERLRARVAPPSASLSHEEVRSMRPQDYPPQESLSPAGQRYGDEALRLGEGIVGEEQAFGADPYQRLLVFRSPCPDGRVLLFWHGGGWTSGYKEWMSFMAPAMVQAGVTFVSAGYRLAPTHLFPQGFEDCAEAVAWVHAHIARWGGDASRLFLGGHSAGGHYAALLSVRRDWQPRLALPSDAVAGCLPISGVYEFGADSGLSQRPRFLGPGPSERQASPLHNIETSRPPFLLACGSRDFPHLIAQARRFKLALDVAGVAATLLELPDCDHFAASLTAGDPAGPWLPAALRFMSDTAAKNSLQNDGTGQEARNA
jgi:acetyl esterase/lipase/carbon monoxide dehydrogenase subunit G